MGNNFASLHQGLPDRLRCAFLTGWENSWRNLMMRAKYLLMWAQRIVYPDVFCIPYWLGWKCDFIRNGARFNLDNYDFILSELNAGVGHLDYLRELIKVHPEKIIILPGPPEIFESYATQEARGRAIWTLRKAGHIWAYSEEVAKFANDYAQKEVARLIPWPFDYAGTRHRGRNSEVNHHGEIRVLIGAPMRFVGIAENSPHFLEKCLAEALTSMVSAARERFKFYGMVYTQEDEIAWRQTEFGNRIGVLLEPRKRYLKFLRFVDSCDAVITLPRFSILGRITFIAAALGKPGIFTDNIELNRRLYPGSLASSPVDEKLRNLVHGLLCGLLSLGPVARFLPDAQAAQEIGNFSGNAAKVREMLCAEYSNQKHALLPNCQ